MTYAVYLALGSMGYIVGRFALRGLLRMAARRIAEKTPTDSRAREDVAYYEEKERSQRLRMYDCYLCWKAGPEHLRNEVRKPLWTHDLCRNHKQAKAAEFYGSPS